MTLGISISRLAKTSSRYSKKHRQLVSTCSKAANYALKRTCAVEAASA